MVDSKFAEILMHWTMKKWAGDEIKLKHNGEVVATLGYGFRDFSKCLKGKGVHRPCSDPVDCLIHSNDQSGLSDGPLIPIKEKQVM